jgi:hypothetical protein
VQNGHHHAMMSVHLLFPLVPNSESTAGTNVSGPFITQQSRKHKGAVTAKMEQ